jgi:flagellar motor switch protein FliG
VLISALDDDAAEAILAQLGADDATKVRSALVELDNIAADEQQRVLADFLAAQQGSRHSEESADSVTLELGPTIEAAVGELPATAAIAPDKSYDSPSFSFLNDIEASAVAGVLKAELPQTVAVVVAHLPPQQAAAVLQELPAPLATEALERIAWIDEPAAEIQAELVQALRRRLAPHIKTARADGVYLAHLSAVLGAMDVPQRQRLLSQLGKRNEPLVNRLGLSPTQNAGGGQSNVLAMRYRLESSPAKGKSPAAKGDDSVWLTFDDLLQFNDGALKAVFAETDTEVALLALTGASPRLIARILRRLAPQQAQVLRHRLEHPGPLRIRDVEQARLALAAVASRLAHEGAVELPASVRFAAAI